MKYRTVINLPIVSKTAQVKKVSTIKPFVRRVNNLPSTYKGSTTRAIAFIKNSGSRTIDKEYVETDGWRKFANLEIWKTAKEKKTYIEDEYTRVHICHWWFRNREKLELTEIEKFHFSMLSLADFDNKFDEIHFTVALDTESEEQKNFVREKIAELTKYGRAKVTVDFSVNNPECGEFYTWRKVIDYIDVTDKKYIVFYSHFKGQRHNTNITNIMFWCYLMYVGCLLDGWEKGQNCLKTKNTYGSLILDAGVGFYAGTFYFINCYGVKKYKDINNLNYTDEYIISQSRKKYYICEDFSVKIGGKENASCYFESAPAQRDYYKMYVKNFFPEYNKRFDSLIKFSRNKGCCYTVITGGYDSLREPEIITDSCDYICFTDDMSIKSNVWKILPIPEELNEYSQCKKARCIKILPYKFIPNYNQYDYTVYVDGSMLIKTNLNFFFNNICNSADFSVPIHYCRNCIYEEREECVRIGKDNGIESEKQIYKYKEEGFPEHFGLNETGLLVRKNTEDVKTVCNLWWEEVKNGSHRDQLSFNYCLWKTGIKINNLPKETVRNGKYFMLCEHLLT